mmetsp:Transcript_18957/g.47366  ORF Transcript_18957/g.47366 Transcript_18957/m.47366 type:complete len:300 (+) Transcript_18957:128-1027(+)
MYTPGGPGSPGAGMYSQVPVGAGQIPVVVSRPKEKVEALLNLLTIVVACLGLILPAVCLANYPQGALTEPVMFLEKVYLVVFAGFLLVMEISHGGYAALHNVQFGIYTGAKLLYRLTGKGIFTVFIGCNCFNMLNDDTQSGFLQVCIYATAFTIVAVGVLLMLAGGQKSLALNSIRSKLLSWRNDDGSLLIPHIEFDPESSSMLLDKLNRREGLDSFLNQFAETYRGQALTKKEFQDLCRLVNREPRFTWQEWDLELIFESITQEQVSVTQSVVGMQPKETVTFDDIFEWLQPGTPLMV